MPDALPDRSSIPRPAPEDAARPSAETAPHDISYREELRRKALHLAALVVPLGMALFGRTWSLRLLIPAALFAVTADVLRARSSACARTIGRVFGGMMRPDEVPPAGAPVSINGATWILISAALLAAVFPLHLAVPAFTLFMIGDAAAALVGRRFGRWHWGRTPRTVEGSAAFFLSGLLVMACFPGLPFWMGAAAALVGAAAEALPWPANDNVRVPFATTAALAALQWAVPDQSVALFGGALFR